MSEQQIKINHAYEWAFGKCQFGELGLGVKARNAVVPAYALYLKDFSTK